MKQFHDNNKIMAHIFILCVVIAMLPLLSVHPAMADYNFDGVPFVDRLDELKQESFNVTVVKNMFKTPYVALNVPETYEGVGSKTGTLIFWAEGVN